MLGVAVAILVVAAAYYFFGRKRPAVCPTLPPAQETLAPPAFAPPALAPAPNVAPPVVSTRSEAVPDTLEKSFADVASTVLDRTGVDDRINPVLSSKNGGMLPMLDVRGDYDALMPYDDKRCDENGTWNQSSKQQSIRLGLIKDTMKRRVVVA